MVLFVYFYQPDMILSYILIAMIIYLIMNSPYWKNSLQNSFDRFFFKDKHLNKEIMPTNIKSQAFVDEVMTKTKLTGEKKKIDKASNDYNIKRYGLMGKFNQFKAKSAKTLDKLEY